MDRGDGDVTAIGILLAAVAAAGALLLAPHCESPDALLLGLIVATGVGAAVAVHGMSSGSTRGVVAAVGVGVLATAATFVLAAFIALSNCAR